MRRWPTSCCTWLWQRLTCQQMIRAAQPQRAQRPLALRLPGQLCCSMRMWLGCHVTPGVQHVGRGSRCWGMAGWQSCRCWARQGLTRRAALAATQRRQVQRRQGSACCCQWQHWRALRRLALQGVVCCSCSSVVLNALADDSPAFGPHVLRLTLAPGCSGGRQCGGWRRPACLCDAPAGGCRCLEGPDGAGVLCMARSRVICCTTGAAAAR